MQENLIQDCILFAYSHGRITEGAGMSLLGLDRLKFRDCWVSFLKANPDIAIATGNEAYLRDEATVKQHQISDNWSSHEFLDHQNNCWRFCLVFAPMQEHYYFLAGCGMPVENITEDNCCSVAAYMDKENSNVGVLSFHDYLLHVQEIIRDEVAAKHEEG